VGVHAAPSLIRLGHDAIHLSPKAAWRPRRRGAGQRLQGRAAADRGTGPINGSSSTSASMSSRLRSSPLESTRAASIRSHAMTVGAVIAPTICWVANPLRRGGPEAPPQVRWRFGSDCLAQRQGACIDRAGQARRAGPRSGLTRRRINSMPLPHPVTLFCAGRPTDQSPAHAIKNVETNVMKNAASASATPSRRTSASSTGNRCQSCRLSCRRQCSSQSR